MTGVNADLIGAELAGLRRLARSLAHGDADDLMQDAAIDALVHPPDEDRPLRPWLAVVLRNRWRMTRRAQTRREAREHAAVATRPDHVDPDDRVRALARLGEALVALDEPFRSTIMARFFDGESAADIARRTSVPAGTVRWRLKIGLDRLRAALDPPALHALAPLGVLVSTKSKLSIAAIIAAVVLSAAGLYVHWSQPAPPAAPVASAPAAPAIAPRRPAAQEPRRRRRRRRRARPRAIATGRGRHRRQRARPRDQLVHG